MSKVCSPRSVFEYCNGKLDQKMETGLKHSKSKQTEPLREIAKNPPTKNKKILSSLENQEYISSHGKDGPLLHHP